MMVLQEMQASALMGILAAVAVKSTLILLLTAAVAMWFRGSAAAVRHLVWLCGISAVLLLPILTALGPTWAIPTLRATVYEPIFPATPTPGTAAAPLPWRQLTAPIEEATPAVERSAPFAALGAIQGPWALLGLAGAGALIGLLWMAVGWLGVMRLGRRSAPVRDSEWLHMEAEMAGQLGLDRRVRLLRGRESVMPATWGILRPAVILPLTADMWTRDRRRAVLAHELAHVKRYDCLTQALAQLACVLYWWNPLVWHASRQLRIERERACDDLVLGTGTRASSYAGHLLEIARAHRSMWLNGPTLVGMARPSQLESRLLWILDATTDRRPPSARATVMASVAALLIVAPLAAARPVQEPTPPPAPVPAAAPVPAEIRAPAAVPLPAAAPEAPSPGPRPDSPLPAVAPRPPLPGFPPLPTVAPRDTPQVGDVPAGARELSVDRLIEMAAVGVTPAYIASMEQVGLGTLTADQLISLRALGVTAAFVEDLRRNGYSGLSVDDLLGLRSLGVTAGFMDQMNAAGFGRLSVPTLVELRAVGVTPAWLAEMRGYGIELQSPQELTSLRAVGVTGRFVEELRAAGLTPLTAGTLTELRAMGVTGQYIRDLAAVGLTGLSISQLVEMRAHGITAEYVRELERAGFGPLSQEQLVRLRVSGVDRDIIRNRRGSP